MLRVREGARVSVVELKRQDWDRNLLKEDEQRVASRVNQSVRVDQDPSVAWSVLFCLGLGSAAAQCPPQCLLC